MAGGDFQVAIQVGDFVIALAAAGFHGHGARHRDLDIGRHALAVGHAILVGAHHQAVALGNDLHGGVIVGLVGILPAISADELVAGDRDILSIRSGHFNVAARIFEDDAFHAGGRTGCRDGVVVLLAPPIQPAGTKADAVLVRLPDARTGHADQDHQDDLAAAEAVPYAVAAPDH